jgi:hypothetical protein
MKMRVRLRSARLAYTGKGSLPGAFGCHGRAGPLDASASASGTGGRSARR